MSHYCPRFVQHTPKPLRVIGAVIGGLFLIAFFALALGAIVMVLWNWLMPVLFGLGTITYWQGFGILLLAQLIFGSHVGHRSGPKHRHDYHHPPVPEGPLFEKWWAREGRAAFEAHIRHTCEAEPAADSKTE